MPRCLSRIGRRSRLGRRRRRRLGQCRQTARQRTGSVCDLRRRIGAHRFQLRQRRQPVYHRQQHQRYHQRLPEYARIVPRYPRRHRKAYVMQRAARTRIYGAADLIEYVVAALPFVATAQPASSARLIRRVCARFRGVCGAYIGLNARSGRIQRFLDAPRHVVQFARVHIGHRLNRCASPHAPPTPQRTRRMALACVARARICAASSRLSCDGGLLRSLGACRGTVRRCGLPSGCSGGRGGFPHARTGLPLGRHRAATHWLHAPRCPNGAPRVRISGRPAGRVTLVAILRALDPWLLQYAGRIRRVGRSSALVRARSLGLSSPGPRLSAAPRAPAPRAQHRAPPAIAHT